MRRNWNKHRDEFYSSNQKDIANENGSFLAGHIIPVTTFK